MSEKNNPEEAVETIEEVEKVDLVIEDNTADELKELKEKATALGVKFSPNIGVKTLKDKISKFVKTGGAVLDEKATIIKEVKLSEKEEIKKAAFHRRKVKVTNLDPMETEDSTTYSFVGNEDFKLGKVVSLNKPIGLEQMLISELKHRKIQRLVHETDPKTGKHTGNFTSQSVNKYNIEFLD